MTQRRISDFFHLTGRGGGRGGGGPHEGRPRGGGGGGRGGEGGGGGEGRGSSGGSSRGNSRGESGNSGNSRGSRGGRGGGGGGGGGRGGYRRQPSEIGYNWRDELTHPEIPIPPPTRDVRAALCVEVMRQTPTILAQHPTATSSSTYYPISIPRLDPLLTTPFPPVTIQVIDGDTYTVGQDLLLSGDPTHPRAGKVSVINLASELRPGGGWKGGSLAQEESLCYRSTLFATLDNKNHYPLTPLGVVYSPSVVVYRKEMKDHFAQYPDRNERFILSVVSVAGLRRPPLKPGKKEFATPDLQRLLDGKIRQTLRALALNEQEYIVLGALGCGAFENPPELVARTFLRILKEDEWKGRFREIWFAVMAGNGRNVLARRSAAEGESQAPEGQSQGGGASGGDPMEIDGGAGSAETPPSPGKLNYLIFHDILDGVVIG